jgi:hypothetical protein
VITNCDRSKLRCQIGTSNSHPLAQAPDLFIFPESAPVRSPQKAKPHVPCTGKWGFPSFCTGPSCLTPPRSQRGLRANNCEAILLKCAGKDKKNRGRSLRAPEPQRTAGILEWWNGGRMEEPEDRGQSLRCWFLDAGQPGRACTWTSADSPFCK